MTDIDKRDIEYESRGQDIIFTKNVLGKVELWRNEYEEFHKVILLPLGGSRC